MNRFFTILALSATLLLPALLVTDQAAAVNIVPNCGANYATPSPPAVCQHVSSPSSSNPIISVIKTAIDIVSIVTGAAAIIGILVSSIKLITAGGDSNEVAAARSGLTFSLIGVAVVVVAQALVFFVLDNVK